MGVFTCPHCGAGFSAEPTQTPKVACPQCMNTVDLYGQNQPPYQSPPAYAQQQLPRQTQAFSSAPQRGVPPKVKASINLGTSIAALLLFFLPWVEMKCSAGPSLANQTGIQAAIGHVSLSAEAIEANDLDPSETSGSMIEDYGIGAIAFLVLIALLAVLGAIVFSGISFSGAQAKFSAIVAIFSLAAFGAISLQMLIGFPLKKVLLSAANQDNSTSEIDLSMSEMERQAMERMFKTVYKPWIFLELVLLAVPAVFWIIDLSTRPSRPPG